MGEEVDSQALWALDGPFSSVLKNPCPKGPRQAQAPLPGVMTVSLAHG